MSQISMFLSEEPHANPLASPASEEDWMTIVATWPSSFADFLSQSTRAGSFGKTSPECLVLSQVKQQSVVNLSGKRRILRPCSKPFGTAGIVAAGECWTANTSESPNAAVASLLSDILETTGEHLQRYYLSPRACEGILRRSEKRGKKLPAPLMQALLAVVERASTQG